MNGEKDMKFILSGGGTGGHVNPALAIGAAIEKYYPGAEIHYVGTPNGIENKLVPSKYPMHHVRIKGLKRSLSPSNIKTAYLTVTSFITARKLLKELKPDGVVGTGGYVCWPVCAAAASLKIPCFLHESNAVPGFAVKMLEKKADVIFVNFEKTGQRLPAAKQVIHVGTPLKDVFYTLNKESARKSLKIEGYRKVVLSFGGSLGAAVLNQRVLELMESYGKDHPEVLFLHATGARGKQVFEESFLQKGLDKYENLRYFEYIYDMPQYMAAADLVICRSGAMTLSEIAMLSKASILIPSPNVTDDQQTKNARLLSDQGAAILLKESEMDGQSLRSAVEGILFDEQAMKTMEEKVRAFAVRDAEKEIVCQMTRVIEEAKKKA
ncbi:MAG: undecaprenyldiphospho-muramoylpentapeptide beta-N-acetylglucosaminyltransferase [Clostridia bacterium]|nr:undecaprenyldiphospho-muramoylpentapeptide beta-N-acetylglucosaminyltransferase [Clostridia bacterium]